MKEFLSVRGRKLLLQILICTILLAVICIWVMVYRTWKAAHLSVGKAKGQMWLSLIMRLLIIFIVLRAAIMRSEELFFAAVGGFFLAMIVYMIHLAIFVYHKNME